MKVDAASPGARLMARLDEFARFSDEAGKLTRLYLSNAHRGAARQFIAWCAEIGLAARVDASGNVWARYEGKQPGAPALMIGSHIDTVRDAGRYDGNLGALAALAVVEELVHNGERLDFDNGHHHLVRRRRADVDAWENGVSAQLVVRREVEAHRRAPGR